MKVEILIVTYRKDFPYLIYCLESIRKFVTGHQEVTVLVPSQDHARAAWLVSKWNDEKIKTFYEASVPLGFLHHEIMVCRADEVCPEADFILHLDSDIIFTEPVHVPDFYFTKEGRPILLVEDYDCVPEIKKWQGTVENALGWKPKYETMRRPGAVHYRGIYQDVREAVSRHNKMGFEQYVFNCKPDYPQGFAEFNTIGAVAMEHPWRDKYQFVEIGLEPWPKSVLVQFWSHGDIDKPQHIWVHGKQKMITPEIFAKEVLA